MLKPIIQIWQAETLWPWPIERRNDSTKSDYIKKTCAQGMDWITSALVAYSSRNKTCLDLELIAFFSSICMVLRISTINVLNVTVHDIHMHTHLDGSIKFEGRNSL